MIHVYQKNIPKWLKKGENYELLFGINEDDEYVKYIEIPKNNFRKTNKIPKKFSDFINLYNTVNFWATEIPESLYNYYKKQDNNGNFLNKNKILRYLYSFGEEDSFSNIMIEYLTGYKFKISSKIEDPGYYGYSNLIKVFVNYDIYNFNFKILNQNEFMELFSIYPVHDDIHFWKIYQFAKWVNLLYQIRYDLSCNISIDETVTDQNDEKVIISSIMYKNSNIYITSDRMEFIININDKNRKNVSNQFEKILNIITERISLNLKKITKSLNEYENHFNGTEEKYIKFINKTYNDYVNPVNNPEDFVSFTFLNKELCITNEQLQYEFKNRFSEKLIKNYFNALFNKDNQIIFFNNYI